MCTHRQQPPVRATRSVPHRDRAEMQLEVY